MKIVRSLFLAFGLIKITLFQLIECRLLFVGGILQKVRKIRWCFRLCGRLVEILGGFLIRLICLWCLFFFALHQLYPFFFFLFFIFFLIFYEENIKGKIKYTLYKRIFFVFCRCFYF